jgi:hypothetical protein
MTEDQFWLSTPKKLQALYKVYRSVHGFDSLADQDTIDSILF